MDGSGDHGPVSQWRPFSEGKAWTAAIGPRCSAPRRVSSCLLCLIDSPIRGHSGRVSNRLEAVVTMQLASLGRLLLIQPCPVSEWAGNGH